MTVCRHYSQGDATLRLHLQHLTAHTSVSPPCWGVFSLANVFVPQQPRNTLSLFSYAPNNYCQPHVLKHSVSSLCCLFCLLVLRYALLEAVFELQGYSDKSAPKAQLKLLELREKKYLRNLQPIDFFFFPSELLQLANQDIKQRTVAQPLLGCCGYDANVLEANIRLTFTETQPCLCAFFKKITLIM